MVAPSITCQDRADLRGHIMGCLRRWYPNVPEVSLREQTNAFERKTFQRATGPADYIDKIGRGMLRAEPSAERSTPSCLLTSSSTESSPPSKRARIASSPSSPHSLVSPPMNDSTPESGPVADFCDVSAGDCDGAFTQGQTVEECERGLRQSNGCMQAASDNVAVEVKTCAKVLQKETVDTVAPGEEYEGRSGVGGPGEGSGGLNDGKGSEGGLGSIVGLVEGAGKTQEEGLEGGKLDTRGAGVGTNGSIATDVSSRLTDDGERNGRVGCDGMTGWRNEVAGGGREVRIGRVRAELGKSSAWLSEERLMEQARSLERTAFRLAKSVREYDEIIYRSLGRFDSGERVSWRQRVSSQERAGIRSSMMKRLRKCMPLADEKGLMFGVLAVENLAWRDAATVGEYHVNIDEVLKIKEKMNGMGKKHDSGEQENGDEGNGGGGKDPREEDGGVLEECDGLPVEQANCDQGEEKDKCVDEEQDCSWPKLGDEGSVSGMGANSLIMTFDSDEMFNFSQEPPWNLDSNESQLVV